MDVPVAEVPVAVNESRPPRLSVRKNFSFIFASNIIFVVAQWLMLAILAKKGNTSVVGEFSLALAVTAPIFLFAGFNLRGVQATDVRGEFKFGHYLAHRLFFLGVAVIAVLIATPIATRDRETMVVILFVALAKLFDSLSDIAYGALQFHERMDRVSKSRVMQGVLQLLALGSIFLLTHSLPLACLGWAIMSGVVTFAYDAPSALWVLGGKKHFDAVRPIWDKTRLKHLTTLALPLTAIAVLGQLNISIPRIILERTHGSGAVGIFSALQYLVGAAGIALGAVTQAVIPRIAHAWNHDHSQFVALTKKTVLFSALTGSLVTAGAALVGRFVLHAVYGPEYAAASAIFTWLALGSVFSLLASAINASLTAAWQFKKMLMVALIVSVVNALGSALLIPPLGIIGGAYTGLLTFIVSVIGAGIIILYLPPGSGSELTTKEVG